VSDQKICPTCGTEYPLSERFCPRDGTALRSANTQADLLGSVVADRYHILKKLGEGGMGTVYLAEHVKMGRKSALKVMNPGMNTDPDAIARFNREASNASRLSHPNICGIYDFGETPDGLIYLAMEFIEGSALSGLIEKGGSLPAPRCGSIIHQTADALQVAHDAGIVHRDLKPDNIMITKTRDGADLVKVVDFGIAKASSSDAQKVTKTGLVVGTPEYMSPEQLAGDKLDGRSDIYSLGLVAFNCLTGKLPFPAETAQEAMIMRLTDRPRTLAETRPDVAWTPELQRTLDKALERDETERYQSAAQFGREFAAAIAAMPVTKAVEAGTLVMGAAGAGAAGAGAASVPATRVHGGGATVPIEAVPARDAAARTPAAAHRATAPAAKKKGPLVPLLGVGTAGIAVVALYMSGVIGGAPAGGAGLADSTGVPVPAVLATDSAPVQANTTPGTTPFSRPQDAAPTGSGNAPANVAAKTPTNAPTSPVSEAADNSDDDAEASPERVATRVRNLLTALENLTATDAQAREAIRRAERARRNERVQARPRLVADTWFVEMVAYSQLNEAAGVCRASEKVLQHPDPARRGIGTQLRVNHDCP